MIAGHGGRSLFGGIAAALAVMRALRPDIRSVLSAAAAEDLAEPDGVAGRSQELDIVTLETMIIMLSVAERSASREDPAAREPFPSMRSGVAKPTLTETLSGPLSGCRMNRLRIARRNSKVSPYIIPARSA